MESGSKSIARLEARVGIEPTHKGFADLSLTTWVPRLRMSNPTKINSRSFDSALASAPLRISPADSRSARLAHARKPAQLGYRALNVKPNLRLTADPSTPRLPALRSGFRLRTLTPSRQSRARRGPRAPARLASLTPANRLNLGTAP